MLVEPEKLQLKLARDEPLLWVRRWSFWDKDQNLIRAVPLEPGLNIIWSRDERDRKIQGAPGHAAGKTLFVLLLRYALGGADLKESVREKLLRRFPQSRTAVEVVIGGADVLLVRSIAQAGAAGVFFGQPFPQIPDAPLAQRNSFQPLLECLAPHVTHDDDALDWQTLIDVVARDQEVRFDDIALWRHKDSRDALDRHELLLRAAGLYSSAENAARVDSETAQDNRRVAKREASNRRVVLKSQRDRLRVSLPIDVADDTGEVFVAQALHQAAEARLREAEQPLSEELTSAATRLERELRAIDTSIGELRGSANKGATDALARSLAAAQTELQQLASQILATPADVCPVCERPLADHSALARARHNLDVRMKNRSTEVTQLGQHLADLERMRAQADDDLAGRELERKRAEGELKEARAELRKHDFTRDQRIFTAKRLRDDAKEHRDFAVEVDATPETTDEPDIATASVRSESAVRDRRTAFARKYAAIVRMLLGGKARGIVELKKSTAKVGIDFEGEKESPAYRVMSVLAFDITAMITRAEGGAGGSALLIHDSPREADMSLGVYDNYFEMLAELAIKWTPFFQAIVTTTTPPPDVVRHLIRVELQGHPDETRLLKVPL